MIVSAIDPDGEGVKNLEVQDEIVLRYGSTYKLTITLINELAEPTSPAYDITGEVAEEGDEHIFFFAWSNDLFANPAGNGNLDNRADPLNYEGADNSKDANGLPLGLTTTWTTVDGSGAAKKGTFNVVLKHQPGLKSETSSAAVGETDLDVTFNLNVY